jgi:rfaE bifunctional protein kinase chain/domain
MISRRFDELLEHIGNKSVAVLGDLILDEYLIGDTKRVSREAPVVVIDYRESVYHPGGAANAAQNVSALDGRVAALGALGNDKEAEILVKILRGRQSDVSGIVRSDEIATAVKTRILAGELNAQRQQVARIDRSRKIPVGARALDELAGNAETICTGVDVVIMSDYGLGTLPGPISRGVIDACRKKDIPVVVDSRFNILAFSGATVATPNEVELFDALDVKRHQRPGLDEVAAKAIAEAPFDGLIVTRGSKGMAVYQAGCATENVGIVGSSDVTDVTGAGDTVAATVALSLAAGATLGEAAEMATYAAAIVVMRRGTATVSREELAALREKHPSPGALRAGEGAGKE